MTYCIKKTEHARIRPKWLKNVLFNNFTPTLLDACGSLDSARVHLTEIYRLIRSSRYLKANTHFELKEDTFTVLTKSRLPVVDFQIVQRL